MKIGQFALVAGLAVAAEASKKRKLPKVDAAAIEKKSSPAIDDNAGAAIKDDNASDPTQMEKVTVNGRELYTIGCSWLDPKDLPSKAWHPNYNAGWTVGYCHEVIDCNSPSYPSEVACCKGAYAGQVSGYCLGQLPSPPTGSPTKAGGLEVWYPDYETPWSEAGCINDRPLPSGRPTYTSRLACCKGAYAGQVSGHCVSELPSPPTTAPTDQMGGVWWPDYDTAWPAAGCKNGPPVGFNHGDRPTYATRLACCKGAYGGQTSGVCLSQLPSPPTQSPTDDLGGRWWPDYATAWSDAGCKNGPPIGFNRGDRPEYDSQLACCKAAYGGQMSGACISQLNSPPTQSPTTSGGLAVFYPDYTKAWPDGVCINDRPFPSGRPTYSTAESCCNGAYAGQTSHTCMCALNACYSCKCPGAAASCPALTCS